MQNKKYSEEQKLEILHKYKNYQGTLNRFCSMEQVSRTTLYKWLKNIKHKNHSKFINLNFISQASDTENPIDISGVVTIISSPIKICINQLTIDFVCGCKIAELKALLELMNVAQ